MQETQVWSLGQEDSLEKEMTTHSSILAWEIPWTEEPGWLRSMGSQKSWTWLRDWTIITIIQEAVYIKDFMYYCIMNLNEDSKLYLFSNPSRNTWYFIYIKSANTQEQLEEYLEDEYTTN